MPALEDVPTIAIEFVSRSKWDYLRDYVLKRDKYLRIGVKEYSVIDRFRRSMTVYQHAEPVERVVAESENYRTPLLPGFELPLAKLLVQADRWARRKALTLGEPLLPGGSGG